jgi:glycosyltransferase involved in cell wall biosynthesis
MRILQLSTFDIRFGASIAARRLHEALLFQGSESDLLVSEVQSDSPRTHAAYQGFGKVQAKARLYLDKAPLNFYARKPAVLFSANWLGSSIHRTIDQFTPDLVHMHWCQSSFVPTSTLPHLNYPLVWTFHDMWAFTGGCHYTDGCDHYLQQCGRCPILQSNNGNDMSHWLWKQKQRTYGRLPKSLHVVCPSNWMAEVARRAPLLEGVPVHVIPNPISAQTFQPIDKKTARRLLGLPEKGQLLLMGATSKGDRRKGFDLLDDALHQYASFPGAEPLGLVTLGTHNSTAVSQTKGLTTWNIGFLQDEVSLCALYNAVDLVALPSREENLSNMLSEALCCGIPCLAFAIGGNGDLIQHQANGYLAKPGDTADMAAGLRWILQNFGPEKRATIAEDAHARVSYEALAPQFLKLYNAILTQR